MPNGDGESPPTTSKRKDPMKRTRVPRAKSWKKQKKRKSGEKGTGENKTTNERKRGRRGGKTDPTGYSGKETGTRGRTKKRRGSAGKEDMNQRTSGGGEHATLASFG